MMTVAELKLLAVTIAVITIASLVTRTGLKRVARVFFLASLAGFIVQVPLGRELNLYTPNITIYVWYVSVAVILTWGVGLTGIWAAQAVLARLLRVRSGALTYGLAAVLVIVVLEFTGSNIIEMKLHDYREYAPLMPSLNAMHAPPWLYVYYGAVQCGFYVLLRRTGLATDVPA